MVVKLLPVSWDRMINAVEDVKQRTLRTAAALEAQSVPYAVIGGNAVAAWVSRVDTGAVRNTRDVDILLRREELDIADVAMQAAGFVRVDVAGIPIYLDGPDGLPSRGVHVIIANEKVKDTDIVPAPDVSESERGENFQLLSLDALVRMKLVANRDKDRTHLRDMVQLGLIDSTWPVKFPSPLAERLQHILDTPDG